MDDNTAFSLPEFLPYLLMQAAEATSRDFKTLYKSHYGMLRTEWRVLFHLGLYGPLTARQICDLANLHKTKVSRAVSALQAKRFLARGAVEGDRRSELLTLTAAGRRAFDDLSGQAEAYDAHIAARLDPQEAETLRRMLRRLAA